MPEKTITIRKLKSINLPSFREDIAEMECQDNAEVTDLLTSYDKHLATVLDKHAPARERQVVIRL